MEFNSKEEEAKDALKGQSGFRGKENLLTRLLVQRVSKLS